MAHTWMLILALGFHCSAPVSSVAVIQRNLFQFSYMINHKGYSAWDYNGYGCWCGVGSYGSLIVDDTDNCCRIHDKCYERIDRGWFGCSPKFVTYGWERRPNKVIECTDPVDTCDRNACECDKAAADCFAKHRSTYRSSFLTQSSSELSKICNL